MGEPNALHNRVVWCDIPVADLDRAVACYAAILGCDVSTEQYGDCRFAVIDHEGGNGGCLVIDPAAVTAAGGILVYFNADGRLTEAVAQAVVHGGTVVEAPHAIGPHGFRALVTDSEGNRLALHSTTAG